MTREDFIAALQEDVGEEGVLIGFVVVLEWMDTSGKRWLTRNHGNASGDPLPEWQLQGYLHNALHTDWSGPEDDDSS